MFDATEIIVAFIGLLGLILTTVAVPWIKAKVSAQRWEQLQNAAFVAVHAAEQIYPAIKEKNGEKLAYAMSRVREALGKQGVAYDEEIIKAAIEAAVLGLKN